MLSCEVAAVVVDADGRFEHFEDALLCECRTEDDGEVGEGGEAFADGVFEVADGGFGFVLDEVPFVDAHHEAFLVALDEREDAYVLGLDAACGVDHEDADVGGFDGAYGADDGIVFDIFLHLVFLAYACGVDEVEVEAELVVARVDGVACGAGDVGDYVAVLADEGVDDRRFAGVGAAYDGKFGYVVELRLGVGVGLGKLFDHFVEEVAGAVAVDGRHGIGVAEPEGVEFGHVVEPVVGVDFVGHEDYGLARFAQDLGDVVVEVGDAVHGVDHKEYFVGLLYGELHLFVDFAFENVVGVDNPTAGVDD